MNLNHDVSRVYRDELMREAEQERLARQAQGNKRNQNPVLSQLGRQMVKLGERLQGHS